MKYSMMPAMVVALLVGMIHAEVSAQFKSSEAMKPGVAESLLRSNGSDSFFGLFDPGRFAMRHSFSLSYTSFGAGRGMSLGMYTNSMYYKIADPLDVQFDVSLMYSPYSSAFGGPQKDFSGIYLTRAQLNYRPSDDVLLQVNFQQLPMTSWLGWGYGFSPFYGVGFPRTQEGN